MGEIPERSGRTEKPIPFRAILEKEDRKWMEEIIQKTIKESVRELNICGSAEQSGTNPPSEDIPDQMMDFLSQMENM